MQPPMREEVAPTKPDPKPRSTRQRAAVREALIDAEGFRSAQEIYDTLRKNGTPIGLTTVYRTLQALVDGGEVDALQASEGETIYRQCARSDHHHHLVCRSCRTSVEVQAAEVESWAAETASSHGFTSVTHVAEVFGTCAACRTSDP